MRLFPSRGARESKSLALLAGLIVLLAPSPASPQNRQPNEDTGTRTVQGVVSDASGKPVAEAAVQLKDTKSLQIRSSRTANDGSYHFAGLSSDVEYELRAEYQGASSPKKTLSVFNTQKTVTVNLKLSK